MKNEVLRSSLIVQRMKELNVSEVSLINYLRISAFEFSSWIHHQSFPCHSDLIALQTKLNLSYNELVETFKK